MNSLDDRAKGVARNMGITEVAPVVSTGRRRNQRGSAGEMVACGEELLMPKRGSRNHAPSFKAKVKLTGARNGVALTEVCAVLGQLNPLLGQRPAESRASIRRMPVRQPGSTNSDSCETAPTDCAWSLCVGASHQEGGAHVGKRTMGKGKDGVLDCCSCDLCCGWMDR